MRHARRTGRPGLAGLTASLAPLSVWVRALPAAAQITPRPRPLPTRPALPPIQAGDLVISAFAADLVVAFDPAGNSTTGNLLWCPGAALWRLLQSPVSGKYGLRTLRNDGSTPIVISFRSFLSRLPNAVAAGDLSPGQYIWKVQVTRTG